METSIKQFTRLGISLLSKEIQSSLDIIKAKYGLSELSLGTISFRANSFNAKLFASLPGNKTEVEAFAAEEARYFALQNNLPQDILERSFMLHGKTHTIIRIETRNLKYPVITRCSDDGKEYKFSAGFVKEILG